MNEPVGLKLITEDKWEVRYSFHLLGVLEGNNKIITTVKTWHPTAGAKV